jgi:hypothetical protein
MKNIFAAIMVGSACLLLPQLAGSEEIRHFILCESDDFTPQHCDLPLAPRHAEIKEIRKAKQLSSKPCIEGKSWVADESGITVKNGCRAEFLVVFRVSDRSERSERWHERSDSGYRQEESEDWSRNAPRYDEDPSDIVIRSFEEILGRRPSRDELRYYRDLLIERNWTERQLRRDLRHQHR